MNHSRAPSSATHVDDSESPLRLTSLRDARHSVLSHSGRPLTLAPACQLRVNGSPLLRARRRRREDPPELPRKITGGISGLPSAPLALQVIGHLQGSCRSRGCDRCCHARVCPEQRGRGAMESSLCYVQRRIPKLKQMEGRTTALCQSHATPGTQRPHVFLTSLERASGSTTGIVRRRATMSAWPC